MSLTNDVIAAGALALVGPAILFVAALFLSQVPPPGSQPARTAQRIVAWYAAHPQFSLWVLLLLLPFSALILGTGALVRTWGDNPQLQQYTWRAFEETLEHWPAMSIGGATLLAGGVLVMITAHLMGGGPRRRTSGVDSKEKGNSSFHYRMMISPGQGASRVSTES